MWDAIVVGARVAGSATALVLARGGQRVLVVDRATFPSDTMSTLFLQPAAIVRLERWGLLDRVRASGAPAMRELALTLEDITITGIAWSPDGVTEAYAPRRTVLDKIMVDAAVAAGAEVREGFVFEDVVRDGDRVVGIRGHARGGEPVIERARIVIGADGLHSHVARAVGAEVDLRREPSACWYYSFYSGVPVPRAMIVFRDARSTSIWPTNDGNAIVVVGWPVAMFSQIKTDLEASFLAALEIAPELAERVRAGRREERFVGTADVPGQIRRSHGPGWALVGDAGYMKDPCTAQGISDAFTYGELLAHKLLAGGDVDGATAAYQAERDVKTRPVFEWTCKSAQLEPPSERIRPVLRAVQGSPAHTAQFLGLLAGTVYAHDFFAPANVARILAG